MNFFRDLSGRRVLTELKQILQEDNPVPAIIRLNGLDLLKFIHPSIEVDKRLISVLNSAKQALAWHDLLFLDESYMKWIVYFLVLINSCDLKRSEEICNRFELGPHYRKIFCRERFKAEKTILELARTLPLPNSALYRKLSEFRTELILFMMAITRQKKVKKAISHYFTGLRKVGVSISGKDLIKLGLKPGPIYRDIFQAALDAKLNGKLKTKKDELDFARNYVP
jgi:tRNA nucleotidyltransferase (CCA-adding enzyme)